MQEYVMGNGAIALGALAAGVNLVAGYPGTPSSEILETISKYRHDGVYIEWSVNEKAAMEVAAAAAYSGARAMVTMKQVGLNVAADPLMSLAYVGVKGGMVIVSADDPGPISSQTEQDTRRFADFCRIPVFDPSSPEEAYKMIGEAFEYSEKYNTPVLFRPTTRVCHAYASIDNCDSPSPKKYEGFVKDSKKWVIFPRLSFANHIMIEKRNVEIGKDFSTYSIEELSPFIEEQTLKLAGKHGLQLKVSGKLDGKVQAGGENSTDKIAAILGEFLGKDFTAEGYDLSDAPALPVRPPVLCAGCPHRASFYAVKKAMKGRKAYFCGDIGCYTLGNAMPLDMVDTCLCMGAGITMAQGFNHTDSDGVCFGFVGDSTFFASGITGVVNAVHNNADMILCVLDNSTTAMTGHQSHPGLDNNLMGQIVDKINIAKVDPLDLDASVKAVCECADMPGVKAVIFKSPCIAISKPTAKCRISDKCIQCKKCIREIGCPALIVADGKVTIDNNLCTGCKLCAQICPVNAIGGGADE